MPILYSYHHKSNNIMRKYLVILLLILSGCKRSSPADILVKPFLEQYYETGIKIVSGGELDSLYCPLDIYQAIYNQYKSLDPADSITEEGLYNLYQKAEYGPNNSVGFRIKYRRKDKPGELFDEVFFIDAGQIKGWGLNVSMEKMMIESSHTDFIKKKIQ